MNGEDELNEQEEDQIINEEYKIWKKNTPFLYDTVITHALEWPSLTVAWFPIKQKDNPTPPAVRKFIVGTHATPGEPNSLLIYKVKIPRKNNDNEIKDFLNKSDSKCELETRIVHDGEVNRARVSPLGDCNLIATKTIKGDVYIFNYFRHPPKPLDNNNTIPDIRLSGHTGEGYGLSWSKKKEGYLASGSTDMKICIWDINKDGSDHQSPVKVFTEHKAAVEDVSWSPEDPNILASCGDDKKLMIWDLRSDKPVYNIEAHSQDVNSVEFNPLNSNLLLTASNDKSAKLWDIRNLTVKIHSFEQHSNDVLAARWNPHLMSIFATYSIDRRINIWDLSKLGTQISKVDEEDGPPELLFTHGGHTARISDFDWSPTETFLAASVADDNIVHLWEMANDIYFTDDEVDNQMITD